MAAARNVGGLVSAALAGVVLCGFAIGAWQLPAAPWGGFAAGLAGAAVIVALLVFAGRRFAIAPRALFWAYAAAVAAWAAWVTSQQVSDFGVYYRCGRDFLEPWSSLQAWAARCESQWLPGFGTYWRRSLLYSLPIGWFSGGSYAAFKAVNAACHVLAVLVVYRLARPALGQAPALLAAALLALYPEFWFVTTVVSSDNLAVPGVALLLACMVRLAAADGAAIDNRRAVLSCVAIAALVAVLDLLRSIGPILILALLLFAMAAEGRARRWVFVAALASAMAFLLAGTIPAWFGISVRQNEGLLATLVGNGVAAPNPFDVAYGWFQYVLPLLPAADRSGLAAGFLAHDVSAHPWLPGLWATKLGWFLKGDGYYFLSNAGPMNNPDDFILPWRGSVLAFSPLGSAVLRGAMTVFCALTLVGLLRMPRRPLLQASLAVGGAFLLLIAVVGESQPRYSVLAAPAFCLLAAVAILGDGAPWRERLRPTVLGGLFVLAAGLLAVGAAWGLADHFSARAPRLAWTQLATADCAASAPPKVETTRVAVDFADRPCHAMRATIAGKAGPITTYLLRTPTPPKWKHGPFPEVKVTLVQRLANGSTSVQEVELGTTEVIRPVVLQGDWITLDVIVRAAPGDGGVSLSHFHAGTTAIANMPGVTP